jgi:hypothetical protein
MPDWPKEFNDQVKMTLDDSALPMEQYDEVLEEWSKGEYDNSITGITRSLVDLQNIVIQRVSKARGLKLPDYRAKAALLASKQ